MPVLLQEVARVQRGPTLRRGIAELDGEGEVAGGVVILRSGKNALAAIDAQGGDAAGRVAAPGMYVMEVRADGLRAALRFVFLP